MKTDLEVIIKDNNIFLTPSHIKSYIIMTLQGLEYLHNKWILHRVRRWFVRFTLFIYTLMLFLGFKAKQSSNWWARCTENWRFWSSQSFWFTKSNLHSSSGYKMVPTSRTTVRCSNVRNWCWYLGYWLHYCWASTASPISSWCKWSRTTA